MGGTSLPKHLPEKWLYLAFAFVGGYGDAVSFVLAKTFTGHITGSLVLAAIAIAAHAWSGLAVHLAKGEPGRSPISDNWSTHACPAAPDRLIRVPATPNLLYRSFEPSPIRDPLTRSSL